MEFSNTTMYIIYSVEFHETPRIPWNSVDIYGFLHLHSHTLLFVFRPISTLSNTLYLIDLIYFLMDLAIPAIILACTVGRNPERQCRACPSHIYPSPWSVRAGDVALCRIGLGLCPCSRLGRGCVPWSGSARYYIIASNIVRPPQGSQPRPPSPSLWPPAAGRRPRRPQAPQTNPTRSLRHPNRPDRARTRTPTTRALKKPLTLQNR